MTAYNILLRVETDPPRFQLVAKNVEAREAQAAIRAYIEGSETVPTEPETYVPVPSRSWQPVTVQAQMELRIVETPSEGSGG